MSPASWNYAFGTIVPGAFAPILAKHSKSFSLVDAIVVGVDPKQRNFELMRKQVEARRQSEFKDVTAKIVIYQAFIEGELDVPKHLARRVHTCTSNRLSKSSDPEPSGALSNAFTSAFKELESHSAVQGNGKTRQFPGEPLQSKLLNNWPSGAGASFSRPTPCVWRPVSR